MSPEQGRGTKEEGAFARAKLRRSPSKKDESAQTRQRERKGTSASSEEHWRALAKAIGRPELAYENSWPAAACTDPRGGVAAVIIDMLSEDSAQGWFRRLSARGVPCAPIVPMQEVLDHPQTRANGLIVEHRHPRWGAVTQTGVLAALSRTPGRSRFPAPELGEHTDEILRHLGYSEPSIASLRQRRLVL